jgi:hypothetical protein
MHYQTYYHINDSFVNVNLPQITLKIPKLNHWPHFFSIGSSSNSFVRPSISPSFILLLLHFPLPQTDVPLSVGPSFCPSQKKSRFESPTTQKVQQQVPRVAALGNFPAAD